ncbi:MAG: hypothetical protein ACREHV_07735 [Rhizomicrobium sp.]
MTDVTMVSRGVSALLGAGEIRTVNPAARGKALRKRLFMSFGAVLVFDCRPAAMVNGTKPFSTAS